MLWVIGGTAESVEFVNKIKDKREYIVTVATYSGKEMLGDANVVVGRLTKDAMLRFIIEHNITLVIDMSHPYAAEVTHNVQKVCEQTNIKYLRYVRERIDTDGITFLHSIDEALDYLKTVQGCVFFTTGMKNISDFEKVKGNNRFVYRILPALFSMEECVKNNLKMCDIVSILGPVSLELNIAMFREFGAKYVIMKDSGEQGGTLGKIQACRQLDITPVVIGREQEEGIGSMQELLEMIV